MRQTLDTAAHRDHHIRWIPTAMQRRRLSQQLANAIISGKRGTVDIIIIIIIIYMTSGGAGEGGGGMQLALWSKNMYNKGYWL